LRGVPKALTTKHRWKHLLCGRGNDLGYGKNVKDITMDNPQPSPKVFLLIYKNTMDAVHRLNVGGVLLFIYLFIYLIINN
jgi:hypothetical protein